MVTEVVALETVCPCTTADGIGEKLPQLEAGIHSGGSAPMPGSR